MPKMKSHSGIKKRVKVTGSGKLVREKCGKRHNLEKKPSKMTRRMTGKAELAPSEVKKANKMLGR